MKKRVFRVHGWEGAPEKGWFPWLRQQLIKNGFEVHAPALPNTSELRIKTWVPALAKAVGTADGQTYFVGHSMGCQTISRYLASLPDGVQVGGAVFVAGFFKKLTNLEDDPLVRDVAKEWLETPLDLKKVKSHLPKSVGIFSDNDPYVPLDNQDDYRDQLGSTIFVEHQKHHFSGDEGTMDLPAALEAVLSLAE